MGNRAVITEFGKQEGIYQHWNGGRDSIEPMLYYAKNFLNKLPSDLYENNLKKVAFISMCCGFNPEYATDYKNLDCANGDNGVYVIDEDFSIIERKFNRSYEQSEYKFEEVLMYIDENMPKNMQKGKDFILKYLASKEVEKVAAIDIGYGRDNKHVNKINFDNITILLEIDDIIYYKGHFYTIIGKNSEESLIVNGQDVGGKPFFNYTERYKEDNAFYMNANDATDFMHLKHNPNSYLHYHYCEDIETGEVIKVLDDDNFRIVNKSKLDEYMSLAESSEE